MTLALQNSSFSKTLAALLDAGAADTANGRRNAREIEDRIFHKLRISDYPGLCEWYMLLLLSCVDHTTAMGEKKNMGFICPYGHEPLFTDSLIPV